MYELLKPLLFKTDPEKAHHMTIDLFRTSQSVPFFGKKLQSNYTFEDPNLKRKVFGLSFKNPVGLAAGFDKDGRHFETMKALGFGFIEIGTVTPRPQAGNDKPRLFRLPKDNALINRMGFNNEGVEAMVQRLATRKKDEVIIGGNIGKNKDTPNEEAVLDYEICFQKLFPHVDYFVVNVSSPNTPNLRALQEKEPLLKLLSRLRDLNEATKIPKPLLLKIAPDLNDAQLDDILDIAFQTNLSGLIATNTTISRSGLKSAAHEVESIGAGGLSGAPLAEKSTEIIHKLVHRSKQKIPVIGVGGICTPDDALKKLDAGASLLQIYSGLVYYGPTLVKDINKYILKHRQRL